MKKYFIEFIIVVLGVSVSFSLDGWRQDRAISHTHESDINSLLQDLDQDGKRLEEVSAAIEEGRGKMAQILSAIMSFRKGSITYDQYAETLGEISYPYMYITFFMNTSTYKSLVATGRVQLFPIEINDKLRDYYEYVAQRAEDNNKIVDDITLEYYNVYHPWVNYYLSYDRDPKSSKQFFSDPETKAAYTGISFMSASLALTERIRVHRQQVVLYRTMQTELVSLLTAYQESKLIGE